MIGNDENQLLIGIPFLAMAKLGHTAMLQRQ